MSDYINFIEGTVPKKSLGQNFLRDNEIAKNEAEYGCNKNVIELGPGAGILTKQLCKSAKSVLAIEKDTRLYEFLKSKFDNYKNLKLINSDFFNYKLNVKKFDIMISNIPYNLSSKTIEWLLKNKLPALLCVQKEFAEHMIAKEGTKNYSKLSVFSSLGFKVYDIMNVKKDSFYPVPKVDSKIIYLKPLDVNLDPDSLSVLGYIMQHKKRNIKNALENSRKGLGIEKDFIKNFVNSLYNDNHLKSLGIEKIKVFQINPEYLLYISIKFREFKKLN